MAALRNAILRLEVIEFAPDIVVDVVQLAALHIEREAALASPAESSAPSAPPFGISTSAVMLCGRFSTLAAGVGRHHLGARVDTCSSCGLRRSADASRQAERAAAVDRQDVVLAGLDVPGPDHLDQLRAVLGGEVVILREVLVEVIELPALRIQLGQLVFVDGRAENTPASLKDVPGHGHTARQPS